MAKIDYANMLSDHTSVIKHTWANYEETLSEVIKVDSYVMNNQISYEEILKEEIQRTSKSLEELYTKCSDPQWLANEKPYRHALDYFEKLSTEEQQIKRAAKDLRHYAEFL